MNDKAVPQGLDVVMQEHSDSIDTLGQDLMEQGIRGLVEMGHLCLGVSQHARGPPTDLIEADNQDMPIEVGHRHLQGRCRVLDKQYGGTKANRQNLRMPEGDTVWLAARRLDEALGGASLTSSDFRVPQLATADLSGRRIESVRAYGKHVLFRIDGDLTLHTHFRMDGAWHLYRTGRTWRGGPDWQIRLVLSTTDWNAVGYRLPVVELLPTSEESRIIGRLGPDVLSPDVHLLEASARVASVPDRAIGDALLDQTIVAGFGLIYVTEGLYLHGITPWTRVGDIPGLDRLIDRTARLMSANRERGAQASTGDLREQHYVYGRAGRPCLRCGTRIRHGRQRSGTYERDAYWCPRCQIGPDGPMKPPLTGSPPPR